MRVLVCPLDWGLGHATRCIPLVRALRRAGHEPLLYASGAGLRLWRSEFPDLEVGEIPSYSMRYARRKALVPLALLLQLPLFLLSMLHDRLWAGRLARKHGAGLVISDGRYGFRTGAVPCVFVTHQLEIPFPGPSCARALFAAPLRALNRLALRGFREVWVPDLPGAANLSGRLAHSRTPWPRVEYVFPLCRFRPETLPWNRPFPAAAETPIDVLALVSGPEPQRSLLEARLLRSLKTLAGTRVLVRGVPPASAVATAEIRAGELNVFDHLPEARLLACFAGARNVVCRSGYTTLMELAGLGSRNVLLVPTPGQPEQEYLAHHAFAAGFAAWQDQDELDVEGGMRAAHALPGFSRVFDPAAGSGATPTGFDLALWIARHPLLAGG